ncbi:hypothetical protein JHK82_049760 [Glycine max]|uniref:NB-ARC domain-containing protein n=1 Tax=Glycine max TaxID=3847 RepID=I1N0L5_SOYBN|nr:hypothetical protein JHK86_049632 [Glycine max]KAG4923885.1 hypothetical protein JHK87_049425 [Glycine soja]KAG4935459.1 hypothetical protein JHK85_050378 [Glycine max]KAG5090982.1 hypothetical protein JHK82_049760 [Glycine max]KAG5094075.1 hypothetical protein JHK84_049663 [Glycine max]
MDIAKEIAVPLAAEHLLPRLKKALNAVMNVPKDVADMKNKLDRIQSIIHDKEKKAADEEGNKAKVKQLVQTSFHMEDIIDECAIVEERQLRDDAGCVALPCKAVDFVKTKASCLHFAYMNEGVESEIAATKDKNESEFGSQMHPPGGNQNSMFRNLRDAPLYIKDDEVVGFDVARNELIGWLVSDRSERTVISVVGIGGLGKTTLAKKVFDKVAEKFKRHAWITVSQSYTEVGLLRDLLQELRKENKENHPQNLSTMDQKSLRDEVINHLRDKRYVIVFDDVWNTSFWDDMEFALIDDKIGSRVFITTRNKEVPNFCKRSAIVLQHDLQPLTLEQSLNLFYKRAFGSDLGGRCPDHLKDISAEMVKKRDATCWKKFSENLSKELEDGLSPVTKILSFSYHDLPDNLKPCFLYFGVYPEDYEVENVRLIRQWVAEGFIKFEADKTLEEVAEQYLRELIQRSLVQVSSFTGDGKPKFCRVHDLVGDMILKIAVDLSFCHFARENENLLESGIIRRLTIASGSIDLMKSVESSSIRSLHIFRDELSESYVSSILMKKYRFLKVLDFEKAALFNCVPEHLGDLFLLRYLSFRNTKLNDLPTSIGMLHNLETLDLRQTMVCKMPREINKLKKLRHLLAYDMSKGVGYGLQMENGIGDLESLQTLREVETNHGGEEVFKELERLTQVRVLGLTNVQQGFRNVLYSLINKLQHMEKLYIAAIDEHEVIDLNFIVSELVLQNSQLQKVRLVGRLNGFPNWVAKLQNLVMLSLSHSKLTDDPLGLLKDLPNLLCLSILYCAYEGSCLHFPNGGFPKLEQIIIRRLYKLNSIRIENGALPSLKKLKLVSISQLTEVPSGVCSLPKLEVFHAINMSNEFEENFHSNRGQRAQWIIEQVPFVSIVDRFWREENSNF